MQLITTLKQLFSSVRADDHQLPKRVVRLSTMGPDTGGEHYSWESRIVELSDGRSVGELKETLYREQLMAGASLVDIGVWRGLFDRSVDGAIGELAKKKYIRLESVEAPGEENDGQELTQ